MLSEGPLSGPRIDLFQDPNPWVPQTNGGWRTLAVNFMSGAKAEVTVPPTMTVFALKAAIRHKWPSSTPFQLFCTGLSPMALGEVALCADALVADIPSDSAQLFAEDGAVAGAGAGTDDDDDDDGYTSDGRDSKLQRK
jgi:hypothetical protein